MIKKPLEYIHQPGQKQYQRPVNRNCKTPLKREMCFDKALSTGVTLKYPPCFCLVYHSNTLATNLLLLHQIVRFLLPHPFIPFCRGLSLSSIQLLNSDSYHHLGHLPPFAVFFLTLLLIIIFPNKSPKLTFTEFSINRIKV